MALRPVNLASLRLAAFGSRQSGRHTSALRREEVGEVDPGEELAANPIGDL